jgi:hypothetical protein
VVGAVHIFFILLAAVAMETGWRQLARRGYAVGALLATLVVLAPMLQERARYLARNETDGTEVMIAADTEQGVLDAIVDNVKQAGGRVYAGGGLGWGAKFQIGNIPFFAFLNTELLPQASGTYHTAALTADLFPEFDERNATHYRLFNVRSVVAPANLAGGLSGFLSPRVQIGRDRVFDAPGSGYFDVVDAAAAVAVNKDNFYDVNRRWLRSDWVEKRSHLWLDFRGDAPSSLARVRANNPLPENISPLPRAGEIKGERQLGQDYRAEFEVSRPAFVLLRTTWHSNWVAYVDGKVQRTAMLSPGFIGVPVLPGQRSITLRYEPGIWKLIMACSGLILAFVGVAAERRGYLARLGFVPAGGAEDREESVFPARAPRSQRKKS